MKTSYTKNTIVESRRTVMRIEDVVAFTGLSRSNIYKLASEGCFPASIPLVPGGTSKGWLSDELETWLEQRIEARNAGGDQ